MLNDSNKLLSLLNLLCNSTQNSSITVRDACYGCFFRVGVLPPGSALLNQLSQCANLYLANTSYAGCAAQLAVSRNVFLFKDEFDEAVGSERAYLGGQIFVPLKNILNFKCKKTILKIQNTKENLKILQKVLITLIRTRMCEQWKS